MSIAPLNVPRLPDPRLPDPRRPQRLIDTVPRRAPAGNARRSLSVSLAKRLLPVAALALLTLVALWPELTKDERRRLAYHVGGIDPQNGQLTDLRYNGMDDHNRPYTVTAAAARQASSERIDLVDPKGDLSLESGSWLMVQSRAGVYVQRTGQLDLSGEVMLYRDDGLTLRTDAATVDLKAGAASSAERVHAEGPFGTLDAQGFSVTDHGAIAQFTGPGRLVLNERPR